jgi:hypothetical protein
MIQEDIQFKPWIDGIPTYTADTGEWTYKTFSDKEAFILFVKDLFKEPGQYGFDENVEMFNEQAQFWMKNEYYCSAPFRSKDYIKYWDFEKEKCRRGAIFISGSKVWYLPREYYMWLNFLRIYDKIARKFRFPSIWDVQYHMALYELLAELHGQHAMIVKKRQIASSYYHCAKLINELWFEEGPTLKIGASESRHIDMDGSWVFLEEYRDFLNAETAWYRNMEPGKVKNWQQRIKVTQNGRDKYIGNKGRLIGLSFEQSATKGVGGACRYFFYEEAGVAPTMDKSYIYMLSALEAGEISTGMFIGAGSVGELKDCDPLKEFIMNPEPNGVYAVETNLIDEKGTIGKSGLFIPEQWGMPPYIDKYGNSQVVEALQALDRTYAKWKKELRPDIYQLKVSQKPRNIAEAFAYREESPFPQHLIAAQKRRIEEREYAYELIELSESTHTGKIKAKRTSKIPIATFPISPKLEDKQGSVVVWERPDENAEWGSYYASIDPVSEGKTTTSESLCSIYVYKTPIEVTRMTAQGEENFIEGDKIVAAWCGRFDDLNRTHERLRLLIEWYGAWTLVENNISLFIQYMIKEKKQQYLVPKNQVVFLKELGANKTVFSDYGWKNTGRIFKDHLLNYLIEWIKEVVDEDHDEDGTILKKYHGIQRIPDPMAMVEMEQYREGVNVDRLVALASLVAFAKIQQANRGYKKRLDNETGKDLEKSPDLFKLKSSPFSNIGKSNKGGLSKGRTRSITKRLR